MKNRLQTTGYRLHEKDDRTQPCTASVLKWRLPWNFAEAHAGQGARRTAEERIKIRDEASTTATQPCAASVEFPRQSGFTILEIILSMAVLALLTGAIYAISMAAMQATQETLEEQLTVRRLEGFLRITRDAFLNLPSNGSVYLDSSNSNGIPDLFFENTNSLFGIPSLGGGILILSARTKPDGTRTFSILRLPKNVQGNDRDRLYQEGRWISLLPKVTKPHWSFFRNGEWLDEWPKGAGRPQLVRLEMTLPALHDPIVATFYVPPISRMGIIPSLDDLLNQLKMLQQQQEQNNNSNQQLPNTPKTPPQQK